MSRKNHHSRTPLRRKRMRLLGYDYSQDGQYFVTIDCNNMEWRFGNIYQCKMILNDFGEIAFNEWIKLPVRYENVQLHELKFMPNHMHAIIELINPYNNENLVGAGLASAPCNNTEASLVCTETKTSLVCTETKTSLVCTETKTSLVCAETKTSLVCTETKTSLVRAETEASLVRAETKTSLVRTETEASLGCAETKTSLVCAETKTSLGCAETKTSLVCAETKTSLVCTETEASLVCAEAETSLVCAEAEASPVNTNLEIGGDDNVREGLASSVGTYLASSLASSLGNHSDVVKHQTLSDIMCAYKSIVANTCLDIHKQKFVGLTHVPLLGKIWKRSFYDHIIRDQASYKAITHYIRNNPKKWARDK